MPALPSALTAAGAGLARSRSRRAARGEETRETVFARMGGGGALALATQAPAAAYLSTWHQSGTLAVMPEVVRAVDRGEVHSGGVLFATPCHQTPFHSHVHRPGVRLDFLKCPPSDDGAPDEADRFWTNPGAFLEARYGRAPGEGEGRSGRETTPPPSHVVAYDSTVSSRPGFDAWLSRWKFRRVVDVHHAHFAVDREKQGRVWMFARPRPGHDENREPSKGEVVEGASAREKDERAREL